MNEKFTLPTWSYKEHYTHVGWVKEGYTQPVYPLDQPVCNLSSTNGDKIYLIPQWVGNAYTIIYDGNGAESGEMSNQIATFGETVNLSTNQFVKTGYSFEGWLYQDKLYNKTFNLEDYQESITLTAVWAVALAGGTGTASDPYLIQTTTDFYNFADLVKTYEKYCKAYYRLDNDLDFNYEAVAIEEFRGVLDGNGHVIKNVTYQKTSGQYSYCSGLFLRCTRATIKNLGVENCCIENTYNSCSGGLIGWMYMTTVLNCYTTGTIVYNTGLVSSSIGGLVGESSGENNLIENCYAEMNLIAAPGTHSHEANIGGLIGFAYGTNIKKCYAITNLAIDIDISLYIESTCVKVAGLVGDSTNSSIDSCFAVTDIDVKITTDGVDTIQFAINDFANVDSLSTCQNCYVLTKALNWTLNGEVQPSNETAATQITDASNLQNESWMTANLFTGSDAWVYGEGEYPQLKVFKEQ